MFSFSPFHSIAARRGDGLLPEFQRLLKPNEATLEEYRKVRAELCKALVIDPDNPSMNPDDHFGPRRLFPSAPAPR